MRERRHIIGPVSTAPSPVCRSRSRRPIYASTDRGCPERKPHPNSRVECKRGPTSSSGRSTRSDRSPGRPTATIAQHHSKTRHVVIVGSSFQGSTASITGGCSPKTVNTTRPPALSISSSAGVGSQALEKAMPSMRTASGAQRPLASASQSFGALRTLAALSRSDAAIAHRERTKFALIEHSRREKTACIDHHKIRSATARAVERGAIVVNRLRWQIDRSDPLGWEQVEHPQGFFRMPGCPKHLEKSYAKTAQHNGFRDSVLGSYWRTRGRSYAAARRRFEQPDQGRETDDNATADQRNGTKPPIPNGQYKRCERERFLSPWPEKEAR
jgi:hypothetical protein